MIGSDYAFAWEVVGGFQTRFEENGGQIVQKLWAPLGAMDLAPSISKIRRDADAVLTMVAGVSTLQFFKQYQDAGLTGKIPIIAGGPAIDESLLPSMGDEGHTSGRWINEAVKSLNGTVLATRSASPIDREVERAAGDLDRDPFSPAGGGGMRTAAGAPRRREQP